MKTAKEIQSEYKITSDQLDKWEAEAQKGNLPGEPVGEVLIGRPLLFGEALKPIAFKETESRIAAIDARAASLGKSRSDYLRLLVERDLATA